MAGSPEKKARRERTQLLLTDEDELEDLFQHIAAGQSLRDYCTLKDVVYSTVQAALTSRDDLINQYTAAMDARSDLQREQIEKLVVMTEQGEIDPKAAAVAIGGRQWLAKVMNRRRYGDQQVVDVAVTDMTKLHIEALRQLARRPRPKEIQATQVIDGEFTALPSVGVKMER